MHASTYGRGARRSLALGLLVTLALATSAPHSAWAGGTEEVRLAGASDFGDGKLARALVDDDGVLRPGPAFEAVDVGAPTAWAAVQQGDATPARRGGIRAPILKIHVAHRQRDHGDVAVGDRIERAQHLVIRLARQRTAMTDQYSAFVTVPLRRLGDAPKRDRLRCVGLVRVEIEIKIVLDRGAEHHVEQLFKIRDHEGHRAKHPAGLLHTLDQRVEPCLVAAGVDAEQTGRLQIDTSNPALTHLLEDRP